MFRWLIDDVSGPGGKHAEILERAAGRLSAQTEQAASNVQQAAATINQLTATVKSNTETAAEVRTLSQKTRKLMLTWPGSFPVPVHESSTSL